MKVISNEKPQVYAVSAQELRIHWNIEQITKEGTDEPQILWEANEALCSVYDARSALIESIISSVLSSGAEIALINNQVSQPEAYAEYQAFRQQAKNLADSWLNKE